MVEDFIEENKAFSAAIAGVIDVSAKGFAESMRREIFNLQAILEFELFKFHVDELNGQGLVTFRGAHDVVIFVRASKEFP